MIRGGVPEPFAPEFHILSRSQMEAVHDASMDVLARTGVRIYSAEATTLLTEAGAHLDGEGKVRIPEHLVDWAVRSAPSNITIFDRDGCPTMDLGRRRTYFGTGSDTPNTIDPLTGERRRPVLSDVANFARVCDSLANIDFTMCMGIASDVPAATAELHHFAAMLDQCFQQIHQTRCQAGLFSQAADHAPIDIEADRSGMDAVFTISGE